MDFSVSEIPVLYVVSWTRIPSLGLSTMCKNKVRWERQFITSIDKEELMKNEKIAYIYASNVQKEVSIDHPTQEVSSKKA